MAKKTSLGNAARDKRKQELMQEVTESKPVNRVPDTEKKRLNVEISKALHIRLKAHCVQQDVSMTDVLEGVISEYLDKQK